jgi:hypothetical protein
MEESNKKKSFNVWYSNVRRDGLYVNFNTAKSGVKSILTREIILFYLDLLFVAFGVAKRHGLRASGT